MKSKVMLFDADGAQVGETFERRARQLVKQQRAEWINESAIRFAADEKLDESEWQAESKEVGSEALLYYMAEKRINERKSFLWHSIFLFPGILLIALFGDAMRNNGFALFMLGGWLSVYAVHAFVFIRSFLKEYRPENHARKLESEVARLRRLME